MSMKSMSGRLAAAAIAVAALGSTAGFADPLGLAEPMRNPGMIFDNAVRDQGADLGLPTQLRRQVVAFSGSEAPGTLIIDTANTYLYYVLGGGRALRYGIGVGREGFTWSGVEAIARKAEWPDWIPPAEMVARQPYLPRWVAGGPGNPLGARALYLGNTAYRIHGTNQPSTIGGHVSSGCIRMLNEDVMDLYERVHVGTKVVVLPNSHGRDTVARVQSPGYAASQPTPAAQPLSARFPFAASSNVRAFGLY
jgi:lipoprotein-anchoring transpeptidase ErfK/SrfK